MYDIKVKITTPEGEDTEFTYECDDTLCITEYGKKEACKHCPVYRLKKQYNDIKQETDSEIKDLRRDIQALNGCDGIKVIITQEQLEAYKKLLEYHVKHDLPELCSMLGYDVTKRKDYQELLKEVNE